MKIIQILLKRLTFIGKIPLCNGIARRAPHIFGFCFPLCYRCTAIFIAFFLILRVCYKRKYECPYWICALGLIPIWIDGGIQTFMGIETTNMARVITGGFFGAMLGAFIARLYLRIDERLSH